MRPRGNISSLKKWYQLLWDWIILVSIVEADSETDDTPSQALRLKRDLKDRIKTKNKIKAE